MVVGCELDNVRKRVSAEREAETDTEDDFVSLTSLRDSDGEFESVGESVRVRRPSEGDPEGEGAETDGEILELCDFCNEFDGLRVAASVPRDTVREPIPVNDFEGVAVGTLEQV